MVRESGDERATSVGEGERVGRGGGGEGKKREGEEMTARSN